MSTSPVVEVLAGWAAQLAAAGIDGAGCESELIFAHYSNLPRLEFDRLAPIDPAVRTAGSAAVARRVTREPLQYILGVAPFMNLDLEVDPAVLIPRPETELLVEFVIEKLPRGGRLLDVGTGSGAIALAVAFERPDVAATALDVSLAALAVARRNAAKYGLQNRVEFRESDLLAALDADERFDLVAANLPYVAAAEYAGLQPEVRDHEPKSALVAADGGLALIFRLAAAAPAFLRPGGRVIFEIGEGQGPRLAAALAASGWYADIKIRQDYNRFDRFVSAQKKE